MAGSQAHETFSVLFQIISWFRSRTSRTWTGIPVGWQDCGQLLITLSQHWPLPGSYVVIYAFRYPYAFTCFMNCSVHGQLTLCVFRSFIYRFYQDFFFLSLFSIQNSTINFKIIFYILIRHYKCSRCDFKRYVRMWIGAMWWFCCFIKGIWASRFDVYRVQRGILDPMSQTNWGKALDYLLYLSQVL